MRRQRASQSARPSADFEEQAIIRRAQAKGREHRVAVAASVPITIDRLEDMRRHILNAFRAADAGARATYDRPSEVLRRTIYEVGLAYRRARAIPELREYVQMSDRDFWRAPPEMTDSAFFWTVRLVSNPPPPSMRARRGRSVGTFPGGTGSSWSRHVRVMERAAQFDIAPIYIGHFVWALGGWDKAVQTVDALQGAPTWIAGLTERAQRQRGQIR